MTSPTLENILPIVSNTLPTFILDINSDTLSPAVLRAVPTASNAVFIPVPIFSNILLLLAASPILDTKLPILEVIVKKPEPIGLMTPNNGVKPLTTPTTASFTVSNMVNTPLKVFLSLLAVSSLILKFSVKSLNLADSSTSFSPDNEGNTSFQASPTDLNPLPKLWNMLVKPLITSSLPPASFQNLSILFLASVEGPIRFSKALLIPVNILVACSLSPIIYSHEVAQPD